MTRAPGVRFRAVLAEAFAVARSQPVVSVVTAFMVAGMCVTVLLTAGKTAGARDAVLSTIDSEGTRSIIVRADDGSGLTSDVLGRLSHLSGIEWEAAFGPAADSTNATIPGGNLVPVRQAWGDDLSRLGVRSSPDGTGSVAWASSSALEQLGMIQPAGGLVTTSGAQYSVVGELKAPSYLDQLQPLVISPQPADLEGPVAVIVVVASRSELVAPLTTAVQSLLDVQDPRTVSISSSSQFAKLHQLVSSQLSLMGEGLTLAVFGLTAVLVAVVLYGLVLLRRKDFGRRRALGARRGLIVAILLIQTAVVSAAGAASGAAIALAVLHLQGAPIPSLDYVFALVVLAIAVSLLGALIPAMVAASRDPLHELRVP